MSFNRCVCQIQNTEENNYDFCANPKRCLGQDRCYCYYGSEERAREQCECHYGDEKVMEDLNRVTDFIGRWNGNIQKKFDDRNFRLDRKS